jgi:hypothetical protein
MSASNLFTQDFRNRPLHSRQTTVVVAMPVVRPTAATAAIFIVQIIQ